MKGLAKKRKTSRQKAAERQKNIRQAAAIILFAAGVFLFAVALFEGENFWNGMHNLLFGLFGLIGFLLPVALILLALMIGADWAHKKISRKALEMAGLLLILTAAIELLFIRPSFSGELDAVVYDLYTRGVLLSGGGVMAIFLAYPLSVAFGAVGASITVVLLSFVFFMLLSGATLMQFVRSIWRPAQKTVEAVRDGAEKRRQAAPLIPPRIDLPIEDKPIPGPAGFSEADPAPADPRPAGDLIDMDEMIQKSAARSAGAPSARRGNDLLISESDLPPRNYILPSLTLLEPARGAKVQDISDELRANASLLEETLRSFGVQTKIVDIARGPTVTRYELQPQAGVKISKITGLADDIALNLAASGVRIEAPIPNKSAIGIEVPNKVISTVKIRDVIEGEKFRSARSRLTIALGKDIAGESIVADIAKMPHLLIAGATGSGKSVCINAIILSLLYKSAPSELELILIDPKVVELTIYNGIPHLAKTPVVTDPRKAAGALMSAVSEMMRRYKLFADCGARDFEAYNAFAETHDDHVKLPQIVIIIDELADLMMVAPNEVEDSICRLAQMARAAGMHLIVATQRPSVDVITGTIKANIPSRIAFAVSSQVDSRTILDGAGAEKLIGRGDMLFHPVGQSKPLRLQGCFVSDKEVQRVVEFIKKNSEVQYDEAFIGDMERYAAGARPAVMQQGLVPDEDDVVDRAIEAVVEAGEASTSYLQRKLKLGYARAARVMDEMEERGIVGPKDGSKPRAVLVSRQQWLEMKLRD